MILFRPVGLQELELIAASGYRHFPPRLPEQPIFYPVLTIEYARRIAEEWNTKSGSLAGFVTRFEIDDDYVQRYPVQTVGGRELQERWVPADKLNEFHDHIRGEITVVAKFYGPDFREPIDPQTGMPAALSRAPRV